MTKHEAIIANLIDGHPARKSALMSAGSNKVGAKCLIVKGSPMHRALSELIGPNGGLTVTGSIVREIMTLGQEEELFPL